MTHPCASALQQQGGCTLLSPTPARSHPPHTPHPQELAILKYLGGQATILRPQAASFSYLAGSRGSGAAAAASGKKARAKASTKARAKGK
jgi:hypothetical protein